MSIFNSGYGSFGRSSGSCGDTTYAYYDIMTEGYEAELEVIKAIHGYDLAELTAMRESYGSSLMEASLGEHMKNIWNKIKAWFKKIVDAIKAFFAKIMVYFDAAFKKSGEFLKKYKDKIDKFSGEFTVNAYEYTLNKIDDIDRLLDKTNYDKFEEISKKTLSGFSADELEKLEKDLKEIKDDAESPKTDDIFAFFRDGNNEKTEITITSSSLRDWVKILEDDKNKVYSKKVTEMKNKVNENEKKISKTITECENESKKYDDDSVGKKKQNALVAVNKAILSVYQKQTSDTTIVLSKYTEAAKQAVSTAKQICAKAINYKEKKDS